MLPILKWHKRGPVSNYKVAQLVTINKGLFFSFLLLKMCWNTYFYSVFRTSQNLPKKGHKKTITFHIFQNTGW